MRHRFHAIGLVVVLICAGLCSCVSSTRSYGPVVLVTGFEPFGNYSVNPSGEIVKVLNGTMVDGALIVGVVVPVNFTTAVKSVEDAIDRYHPVLVISTGLNARLDGRVAVEQWGMNLRQRPRVDGRWVPPVVLVPGGPMVRRVSIPVERCVASLRAAGVPCRGSVWAGTYVCNVVLYETAGYVEGSGVRFGFVHVPLLVNQSAEGLPLSLLVAAVQRVVATSLGSCS